MVFGAHFTQFVEPAATVGDPGYYGERYGRYLGERGDHEVRTHGAPDDGLYFALQGQAPEASTTVSRSGLK